MMHRLQGSRRWVLGALAVAAALLVAEFGAEAAEANNGFDFQSDYGSTRVFEKECEKNGGTFVVDGWGTECQLPNGTRIRCDSDGGGCVVGILVESDGKVPVGSAETDDVPSGEVLGDVDSGFDDGNIAASTVDDTAEPGRDLVVYSTIDNADRFKEGP